MESEVVGVGGELEIAPRVAAIELLETYRILAKALCPKDVHLQEDLMQEMALATLECASPRTPSGFCVIAMWRARDYLRQWTEMSKRPGCEVNSHSVLDPRKKAREEELARIAAEKAEAAIENLAGKKAG